MSTVDPKEQQKQKRPPPPRCSNCNRFMSLYAGALYFCSRCEGIELPHFYFGRLE